MMKGDWVTGTEEADISDHRPIVTDLGGAIPARDTRRRDGGQGVGDWIHSQRTPSTFSTNS